MRTTAINALLITLLGGCVNSEDFLNRVMQNGKLLVVTRNVGTTYYERPEGPLGIEYELAKAFANDLGLELRLIVVENVAEVLQQLKEGRVHFAAAGLSVTHERRRHMRFTPPYQEITAQLIYRKGSPRPRDLDDLQGHLSVVANSSHAELLRRLHHNYQQLSWSEAMDEGSDELLARVWEKSLGYTVADSNEFQLTRRFYPELRAAFDLGKPEPLAWAFPKTGNDAIYREAIKFFNRIRHDGTINQLIERYYGHVSSFDYVGTRTYRKHISSRLPEYQPLFKEAGNRYGIDWRLLAAMAYQESHWDPHAVSPTGVRGIMMLTRATATHLGVTRRTDPVQSIDGGARYLARLLKSIPERIGEPDRTWMAVASYNIGFFHLEDARVITQKQGGNPDSWKDVKKSLPLLRQRKWYKQTKKGYARGDEAVTYVKNIRSYYDILMWQTDKERSQAELDESAFRIEVLQRELPAL